MASPAEYLRAPFLTTSAGVYLISNQTSGKLYVGSASNLAKRHGEHQRRLRRKDHENDHLQKAWDKHGDEAFEFLVLLICAPDQMIYFEQRALDYYKVKCGWRQMYNANPNAASGLGRRMSARSRALLLERLRGNQYTKGHALSPEHKEKIRIATTRRNLGSKLSEETKVKIGNANRGRIHSPETRAKISAAGKGRKMTAEHKARLASSPRFSGRHHSEEAKQRMREKLKERIFSDEHRAKISAGVRAYRERQRQAKTQ